MKNVFAGIGVAVMAFLGAALVGDLWYTLLGIVIGFFIAIGAVPLDWIPAVVIIMLKRNLLGNRSR